jgi:hypothetical protein
MRPYAELGMQHVQLSLVMEEPARFVQDVVAREIVPRLREIVGHVFLLTSPRHGRA